VLDPEGRLADTQVMKPFPDDSSGMQKGLLP